MFSFAKRTTLAINAARRAAKQRQPLRKTPPSAQISKKFCPCCTRAGDKRPRAPHSRKRFAKSVPGKESHAGKQNERRRARRTHKRNRPARRERPAGADGGVGKARRRGACRPLRGHKRLPPRGDGPRILREILPAALLFASRAAVPPRAGRPLALARDGRSRPRARCGSNFVENRHTHRRCRPARPREIDRDEP